MKIGLAPAMRVLCTKGPFGALLAEAPEDPGAFCPQRLAAIPVASRNSESADIEYALIFQIVQAK